MRASGQWYPILKKTHCGRSITTKRNGITYQFCWWGFYFLPFFLPFRMHIINERFEHLSHGHMQCDARDFYTLKPQTVNRKRAARVLNREYLCVSRPVWSLSMGLVHNFTFSGSSSVLHFADQNRFLCRLCVFVCFFYSLFFLFVCDQTIIIIIIIRTTPIDYYYLLYEVINDEK